MTQQPEQEGRVIIVTGVDPELKERIMLAAAKLGISMAAWIRMRCVMALEEEEKIR